MAVWGLLLGSFVHYLTEMEEPKLLHQAHTDSMNEISKSLTTPKAMQVLTEDRAFFLIERAAFIP